MTEFVKAILPSGAIIPMTKSDVERMHLTINADGYAVLGQGNNVFDAAKAKVQAAKKLNPPPIPTPKPVTAEVKPVIPDKTETETETAAASQPKPITATTIQAATAPPKPQEIVTSQTSTPKAPPVQTSTLILQTANTAPQTRTTATSVASLLPVNLTAKARAWSVLTPDEQNVLKNLRQQINSAVQSLDSARVQNLSNELLATAQKLIAQHYDQPLSQAYQKILQAGPNEKIAAIEKYVQQTKAYLANNPQINNPDISQSLKRLEKYVSSGNNNQQTGYEYDCFYIYNNLFEAAKKRFANSQGRNERSCADTVSTIYQEAFGKTPFAYSDNSGNFKAAVSELMEWGVKNHRFHPVKINSSNQANEDDVKRQLDQMHNGDVIILKNNNASHTVMFVQRTDTGFKYMDGGSERINIGEMTLNLNEYSGYIDMTGIMFNKLLAAK